MAKCGGLAWCPAEDDTRPRGDRGGVGCGLTAF